MICPLLVGIGANFLPQKVTLAFFFREKKTICVSRSRLKIRTRARAPFALREDDDDDDDNDEK